MTSLAGIAITLGMVFGGYLIAGGKLEIILHSLPYEMMIIGGAAIGSFLVGNDVATVMATLGDIGKAIRGPKWKRQDYQDVLCLMFELLRLARESALRVESHIENPESSTIFARYPKILKDHEAVEIICDTIRSILMNFNNPHQVEELLEKQLEAMSHEEGAGAHALQKMADGLPALGIVAAVLGVIKTMASIDKPPEVLGQMIGGALVGTFLGVFLAYGLVGPFADRIAAVHAQDHRFYLLIRETIVASLQMHEPKMCVEVGRRNIPRPSRPSFSEIEEALKQIKKEAA
ncbi:MAG TPA: flagellar motor stator protein MotA [Parvularcula sp.]|nr:flagellar motor stator protein MotA [Parvularcula sp.]HBS31709.1 flagellar motor stator protein MotA [Parvularcula sp.]HBS35993.1 flagellar motor stator protein MotA [Parvularcula sp.]